MPDEFDLTVQAEDEARQSGGKFNYGKLTIKPRFVQWVDKKPAEVSSAIYATLPPKEKSMEYVFAVDIQEFKPSLKFTYERKVQVGGLDWNKILKPSLAKIAGENGVTKEGLPNTLRSLNGRYVCVEDVPQTPTKSNPDKSNYNTVALAAVFQTRELCYAAYEEKYGKEDQAPAGGNGSAPKARVPIGYNLESWVKIRPEIEALHAKYKTQFPPIVALKKTGEEYGATGEDVADLLGIKVDAPAAETPAPAAPTVPAPAAQGVATNLSKELDW